jgi:hypothetical protein
MEGEREPIFSSKITGAVGPQSFNASIEKLGGRGRSSGTVHTVCALQDTGGFL